MENRSLDAILGQVNTNLKSYENEFKEDKFLSLQIIGYAIRDLRELYNRIKSNDKDN